MDTICGRSWGGYNMWEVLVRWRGGGVPTHCQRQHKGVGGCEPSTGTMGHKLGGAFFFNVFCKIPFGNEFARYLLEIFLQEPF